MNRVLRLLTGMAVVLGLAACVSAPTRFYTLLPQSPFGPAATTTPDYRIAVLPVTIPQQLDQPQLLIRQSDDRVVLLEGERWVGPLDEQIRTAVSDQLSHALGAVDVHDLPQANEGTVYRVKLDIRRFESIFGRYALIDAVWSVHGRGQHTHALRCRSSLKMPVDKGYDALIHGHQQALAALSAQIAVVIRTLAVGVDVHCPG